MHFSLLVFVYNYNLVLARRTQQNPSRHGRLLSAEEAKVPNTHVCAAFVTSRIHFGMGGVAEYVRSGCLTRLFGPTLP